MRSVDDMVCMADIDMWPKSTLLVADIVVPHHTHVKRIVSYIA